MDTDNPLEPIPKVNRIGVKHVGPAQLKLKPSNSLPSKGVQDENLIPQERPTKHLSGGPSYAKPRYLEFKDLVSKNKGSFVSSQADQSPKCRQDSYSGNNIQRNTNSSSKYSVDLGKNSNSFVTSEGPYIYDSSLVATFTEYEELEDFSEKPETEVNDSSPLCEKSINIPFTTSDKKSLKNPLVSQPQMKKVTGIRVNHSHFKSPHTSRNMRQKEADSPIVAQFQQLNGDKKGATLDLSAITPQNDRSGLSITSLPQQKKKKTQVNDGPSLRPGHFPAGINKFLATFDKKKDQLIEKTLQAFEAARSISQSISNRIGGGEVNSRTQKYFHILCSLNHSLTIFLGYLLISWT